MQRKQVISVCMATYNGEKYVKEQLISILSQLELHDEVIVSDDGSSDKTLEVIQSLNDQRITIFKNNFKNVVLNFEFAIKQAKGDFIFLSDQDDIWDLNKVKVIYEEFKLDQKLTFVFSNANLIDGENNSIKKTFFMRIPKVSFLKIIYKNEFLGCTIAFKRKAVASLLPFPKLLPMHDWWIGINHLLYGKILFINQPLISYRRHGNNVTTGKRSSILQVLGWRWTILKALLINQFKKKNATGL